MSFIEAPTTFYLGRRYDPVSQRLIQDVLYYDSRDLTTHAVVVGMTGSGKTGLCIDILEEAILDNIPAIVIDPKGDITNLLLMFPDLRPEEFAPWVNVDDARRAGKEVDEYAADVAARWRDGLQTWGIVPDRVKWARYAAQYSIYTPGSDSGLPVSILDAMQPPGTGWDGHEEENREHISSVVTALLALVGKQVEPVKNREHVLIANIFENAWRQGLGLTLEDVIVQVQQPPFARLGVFDVDTFFPEKERFKLAMELNNIIAAPSFQSWLTGRPLDVGDLLYTPDGRPRVSIFYTAHLNDGERQFISTLLLENILTWMRTLSGTTSLRALLYIDEVFGMIPPHPRNPPTKDPLLKLLKQARAFGLGVIVATQNPGDLDYKGLSNAGSWFIGKLQTEHDRRRVLAGLEALADSHPTLNPRDVRDLIAQLDSRVFLLHNIHDEGGPAMFHTRWSMSYLRGPLTRSQVNELMASQRAKLTRRPVPQPGMGGYLPPEDIPTGPTPASNAVASGFTPPPMHLPEVAPPAARGQQAGSAPPTALPEMPAAPPPPAAPAETPLRRAASAGSDYTSEPPVTPSSVPQFFLPTVIPARTAFANWERQYGFAAQVTGGASLIYRPFLLAQVIIHYLDRKTGISAERQYAFHVPDIPRSGLVRWEQFMAAPVDVDTLAPEPFGEALYAELPPALTDERRMKTLQSEVLDQLYRLARLTILYNPTLKIFGEPDATTRDFKLLIQPMIREKRDAEVDQVTARYAVKLDRLEEKLRRETRELYGDRADLSDRRRENLFTAGEAAMSLFRGRTTYTLSRYSRTQRYSRKAEEEVRESEEEIAALQEQIARVTQEMEGALRMVNDRWAQAAAQVEEYHITPLRKNIYPEAFGVGWMPFWYAQVNGQPALLAANPVAAREQNVARGQDQPG